MSRAVVSVATGKHFRKGQERLVDSPYIAGAQLHEYAFNDVGHAAVLSEWPTHQEKPFAFKAYALKMVADLGDEHSLLWCDSCILPIRSLDPVWEHIEKHGAMIMRNGFQNSEWTADSALPDLFPELGWRGEQAIDEMREAMKKATGGALLLPLTGRCIDRAHELNEQIPHVVAGCFGIDLRHEVGRAILEEYYRLASETRAFCGPTTGPIGVRHRHDQTALSVIAWRLGVKLVDPPQFFSYAKDNSTNPADYDERTCLIAHGAY